MTLFANRSLQWVGLSWAVLGVALLTSVVVSLQLKKGIDQDAVAQSGFVYDQATLKIQEHLEAYALILRGGAGLFAASDTVSRQKWRAYVEKLTPEKTVPGVQGIGYAQVIAPGQLSRHIEGIRQQGFADYTVRPPGERATTTAIVYLEPFRERNLRAFGYDMFSEPVRRTAMEQARDTGTAALSGKVQLVQETAEAVQAGTLMYVPVYRNGAEVDTVEQRRTALLGWVYSPYRMQDLMRGMLQEWDHGKGRGIDLDIYDGLQANAETLMFNNDHVSETEASTQFLQERSIHFNGHSWLLVFDNPDAAASLSYAPAWASLLGGFWLAGMLFGLMRSVLHTRIKAHRIAGELTQQVRAREAFAQAVLNSVNSQIAVIDQAATIVVANEVWLQFSRDNSLEPGQITPGTDIGSNYLKACSSAGDSVHEVISGIQAVLDGSLPMYSLEYPCHSPQVRRWFVMSVSPMRFGQEGAVIVHSNITERKLAEERLIESELRLNYIIEGTYVGTWEWEVQTGKVVFNECWAQIVGYTLAELAPASIDTWVRLAHPDDMKRSSALLEQHFAGKLAFYDCQARMRHKDGHWVWVHDRGRVASWSPDGKPFLMSGTHQDISAQKALEESLIAAQLQAEAANYAKSRFLATMSHEIRTPMNGVLGMAQLLIMPNLGEAERRDYARTILSSGNTLMTLLNDILDLSKIEAGKFQLDNTAFETQALLHETRNLFAGAAQAKGLQIDCQWSGPHDQRYLGDSNRVRQMLANLVGNALKFTLQGHIRMEAKEIERSPDGVALIEFSVQDSGIGIAPEKLDLLFKPFSQADSSTTREFGGSGLGLSIVRQLALALGGDVGVSSEAGVGSRFWFRVRVRRIVEARSSRTTERAKRPERAKRAVNGPTSPAAATHLLQGHVLVAEDNHINCIVIESLLVKLGLTVTLVENGQQAVDAIKQGSQIAQTDAAQQRPDLVLMDLQMPVLDGYSATRRIRQWEADAGQARLPIVALTADAFEEDRQSALEAGMDDFLCKPIAIDALRTSLGRWLPAPASTSIATQTQADEALALRPLDRQAFCALVDELTPLLAQNKFSAISRFHALQTLVAGTALADAIDALAGLLNDLHFDQALQGLRFIASGFGTQATPDTPVTPLRKEPT